MGIPAEAVDWIDLGWVKQKGGKTVYAWAFEGDLPGDFQCRSNMFEMEWPPHSGKMQSFPEVDQACFFSLEDAPLRTRKHIASPQKKSTCKRLNMFLRWMVRQDDKKVDFGIWKKILPSQLICPIDIHVSRVAKKLSLVTRKQTDWLAALELTGHLRTLDKNDPVKYDFALFALGSMEKHG